MITQGEFSLKDEQKQQLEMFLMMDFKIDFCFGTVYTLWVYPDLLPAFATWPPVLQKLAGGAGKSSRTLSLLHCKKELLSGLFRCFPSQWQKCT